MNRLVATRQKLLAYADVIYAISQHDKMPIFLAGELQAVVEEMREQAKDTTEDGGQ
jgi:hypothetical protein